MEQRLEQNSLAWKMSRLGNWNGSEIHQLMKSGRGKDKMFGDTAMTYIYEVASQRNLLPKYREDEAYFTEYDELNFGGNKYTEYGHQHEEDAAAAVRIFLDNVVSVRECGRFIHDSIPNLSASPDRIMTMVGNSEAVLEIKCPQPKTWMKCRAEITDAETLKAVKPEYYWQLQAEMMCSKLTDSFICFYSHFEKAGLHMVHIPLAEDAEQSVRERVIAAENIIEGLLK